MFSIRTESLDAKVQCIYFCICLIINIKYIVAHKPTMIKEYRGLNATSWGKWGGIKLKEKG
jgi:hypothetical protein